MSQHADRVAELPHISMPQASDFELAMENAAMIAAPPPPIAL
ncbi:hypothetical protein [Polaromonas jejuensis]|uniref:Uncharacterized protein n=1 Tax=Polaromonas jejuensis TaxID=457502 RepID=A0ABW0QFB1_9BURK|nr:hypothetical protein [Polaromonas jejuensis]